MDLLIDLGRTGKTVKQLTEWLKRIENYQALDILGYQGNYMSIEKKNNYRVILITLWFFSYFSIWLTEEQKITESNHTRQSKGILKNLLYPIKTSLEAIILLIQVM